MRVIRASEISTYIYCQRAWWFKLRGYASDNTVELETGTAIHQRHGRSVRVVSILQYAAYGLILIAFLLLVVYFVDKIP